jgi:surfeit locus 1 family protein
MGAPLRQLVLPALLTLIALGVLVSLGNWQVRRLAWKEDLIARATERPKEPVKAVPSAAAWPGFDVADNEYRPYRLAGHFLHDKEALVFTSLSEPKGHYGGPGFWVVTPFVLSSGGTVLVNRGFVPQGRERPADRGETLSDQAVAVVGLLRPDDRPGLFTPADRPDQNVFYSRHIAAISAAKGLLAPIAPFTIDLLASKTPPGGLPQAGETLFVFPNNHLQYAITWYGLAVVLLAVFVGFAWTRLRPPSLTPPGHPH